MLDIIYLTLYMKIYEIADIHICTASVCFLTNMPLDLRLLFLRRIPFVYNKRRQGCPRVFCECVPPKVSIDPEIILVFLQRMIVHRELPVKSWFLGVSLISVFLYDFIISCCQYFISPRPFPPPRPRPTRPRGRPQAPQ